MSLERFEVGIVSADRALVDFLIDVFDLDELPTSEYPFELQPGTRLAIITDPDGNTMEVSETA